MVNILGQLNLFNEAELEQDFNVAEVEELAATIPTGSPKKKKTKATDAERFNGIPVIKKYLDIPEDEQTCPVCNNPLVKIGEEFVRRELIFIPAKLKAVEIYNFNYSCPECRKREIPVVKKGKERKPDSFLIVCFCISFIYFKHISLLTHVYLYDSIIVVLETQIYIQNRFYFDSFFELTEFIIQYLSISSISGK